MNRRTLVFAGAGALVTGRSVVAQSGTPIATDPPGNDVIYRIDLAGEHIPEGELIVGAVWNVLGGGTSVVYPAGGSAESLVIDYIVSGAYQARSTVDLILVAGDGETETVAAGEQAEVSAGDALVIVENEEEQETIAAGEDTITLSFGLFTFEQGTGEVQTEGELTSTFLGAGPPIDLPEGGVTVLLLEGAADAAAWPDALMVLPVSAGDPASDWTFVLLPIGTPGASPEAATPAS